MTRVAKEEDTSGVGFSRVARTEQFAEPSINAFRLAFSVEVGGFEMRFMSMGFDAIDNEKSAVGAMSHRIASALTLLVHRGSDGCAELHTSIGVDVQASRPAPENELFRIEMRFDGDHAAAASAFECLIGAVKPLLEGGR